MSLAEYARFSLTLRRVVTRKLQPNLVPVTGPGHAKPLGNGYSCNPDDDAVPNDEGDSVSRTGVDFTINEDVFELFLGRKSQRLEAVAVSAVPDCEARFVACR